MDIEYKTSFGSFIWDTEKANSNVSKHGLSFEQAVEVFLDPFALIVCDDEHSYGELRMQAIGRIQNEVIVFVVFTERGLIRVISARRATTREIRAYEEDN